MTGRKNELLDREMKACVLVVDKSKNSQQLARDVFSEEAIVAVNVRGSRTK